MLDRQRFIRLHVRQPVDLTRRQIHAVDVADAVLVRHEEQTPAVLRELRIDVLALRERRMKRDLSAREIHRRELQVSEGQLVEVRPVASIGGERDGPAIRRERRHQLRVAVVRELPLRAGLEIDQVQVADAALRSRDQQLAAVGRPHHVVHRAHAARPEALFDVAVPRVHDRDLVVSVMIHDVREVLAVGGEVT